MSTDAHDEVELLERSLADARREHERGELDDATLARIEAADGARLAAARARLPAAPATPDPAAAPAAPRAGPRRRRRGLLALGIGSLLVAALVVAIAAADPRSTPRARPTRAEQLHDLLVAGEAEVAVPTPVSTLRALSLFDAALRLDPHDPEALVESAWLRYLVGAQRHDPAEVAAGAAGLARDVRLLPGSAAAHLDDGIVLLRHDHDPRAARAQLLWAGRLPETAAEQYYTEFYLAIARSG